MVRVIESLCDVCHAEDMRVPGQTESVSINGGPTVLLDLCPDHRATYIQPLLDIIAAHGMTEDGKPVKAAERSPRGAGDVECDYCGKRMATMTTLSSHMKSQHPENYPAYMKARGFDEMRCKVKGCGQTFYGSQALSMHTFRAHS